MNDNQTMCYPSVVVGTSEGSMLLCHVCNNELVVMLEADPCGGVACVRCRWAGHSCLPVAFHFCVEDSCLFVGVWCSWKATRPGMPVKGMMLLSSVVMLMLERVKSVWKAIRSMAVGVVGLDPLT